MIKTRIFVFLMFCNFLLSSGCDEKTEYKSMDTNQVYINTLGKLINGGAKTIDLNDVIKFDWDRACIVTPYMSLNEVEAMLGFRYPDYDVNLEETWGIIFTLKKNVAGSIKINRYKVIDYFQNNNVERFCLTERQPIMSVIDKQGRPALMPIQK